MGLMLPLRFCYPTLLGHDFSSSPRGLQYVRFFVLSQPRFADALLETDIVERISKMMGE